MAMRLGISPAAYGKIEVCGRVETAEQLRRLAAVLGVSEAQLRGEGLQGWERPDCRSRQAVALWTR
jgi:transcriptional regulator with XRE-family HTH domain